MNKPLQFAVAAAALTAAAAAGAAALKTVEKRPVHQPASLGNTDPAKKAILVISFGTSYEETREKTIGAIEEDFRQAFPDFEIRRAFTSNIIINKLKKRDGIEIDTVEEALQNLANEGFGTVICQPTHVMNGFEYDGIVEEVSQWKNRFIHLICGHPLLTTASDYRALVSALKTEFHDFPSDRAFVLMGHGTDHFANSSYPAFDYYLKAAGCKNFFVGTVEGDPELSDVIKHLKESGLTKVTLTPLMVVAGDHATNDMCGDDEDSWKNQLLREGFEVDSILKGLGEYPSVRTLYLKHGMDCIEELQEEQIRKN